MHIRNLTLDRMDDMFCKGIVAPPPPDYATSHIEKSYPLALLLYNTLFWFKITFKGDRPALVQRSEDKGEENESSFFRTAALVAFTSLIAFGIGYFTNHYRFK